MSGLRRMLAGPRELRLPRMLPLMMFALPWRSLPEGWGDLADEFRRHGYLLTSSGRLEAEGD